MHIRAATNFLLCGILLAANCAAAQESTIPVPSAPKRPKLGLVLEGGGALGLAHVGVLQWMEEHHIPVSYVAGTSMGGLVGGLYATGRSATEVREVVSAIPWDQVLRGQTPFQDLAFRRKEDAHEYPSSLEFGLHHGVQFPAGFNTGQGVSLILDRVALPYSDIHSFDDLPIPFACVATDLVSGKEQVFRSGPLSVALRSTMSLPGFFTPVRYDDHLLADGGLLNNFPIDIAKEMGADVVLGIHLQVLPLSPEANLSSFAVLGRSISVMIAANELRSMEQADLLVTVPLQKYTSSDYDKTDPIIKAGYDAAAAKATVLSSFSVNEAAWEQYLAERNARRKTAPVPQFVEVAGTNSQLAGAIEKEASGLVGQPIDQQKLEQGIMTLAGMGRFSNLSFSMVERDSHPGLQIKAEQKPYAPPVVRPLISIDGSDYNNVLFSLGARITFVDFGGFRSELRSDLIVGSQYGGSTEYYRPFTANSRWFVAPRGGFFSTQYPIYSGDNWIASYRRREAGGGVDVGYEFGRSGELRLGYEGGYQRLSRQIGSPTVVPVVSGASGDVRVRFELNQLDDPVIPRSGQYFTAFQKFYNTNPGTSGGFPLFEGQVEKFFRLSEPTSIFAIASGGSSYGYKVGVPAFSLGGSQRLVAYGTNALLTNQYFVAQLGYLRRLAKLPPFLGDSVNAVGLFEVGKTYQLPNGPPQPYLPGDVVGGIIVNTIFGPVEVAGAVGNYGRGRFFFRIGRIF
jgi:NTE family protein